MSLIYHKYYNLKCFLLHHNFYKDNNHIITESSEVYQEFIDILNEVYADEFFDDETIESYKGYY